ncbi:MAG TPA: hypothetical protein VMT28_13955 [Terriglobales bacterium]|nr:hypothetical protein [Terriglobales bacterium]
MKAFSKVVFVAAVVCVIAAGSISALAVPMAQVLREVAGGNHTGKCCSVWDESIRFFEPETMVPVVVTWSADYQANAPFLAGLSLNGGPCTFYGPAAIPTFTSTDDTYASKTFQWVIMPGDYGLVKGPNTICLCGGGVFADTDSITLGFNTLAARLGR